MSHSHLLVNRGYDCNQRRFTHPHYIHVLRTPIKVRNPSNPKATKVLHVRKRKESTFSCHPCQSTMPQRMHLEAFKHAIWRHMCHASWMCKRRCALVSDSWFKSLFWFLLRTWNSLVVSSEPLWSDGPIHHCINPFKMIHFNSFQVNSLQLSTVEYSSVN